jgi:serine/threonine protein phosphatase PrpC
MLATSRTLGDAVCKRHPGLVSPHPDVTCRALTRGDRFAILATDGLWDVVSDQEAVTVVNKVLGDGTPSVALCEEAAAACVAKARKERTMDNVLVLVLCFLWNDAAT